MDTTAARAMRHAALGDPMRLAIVDELATSDRAPTELGHRLGIESNLLAHHLDVLEHAGLVTRHRSSGDGRRRYVRLERAALGALVPASRVTIGEALFVCTHNSARSQLAAVLWHRLTGRPATSAGTSPASAVHPGAVEAARRAGLDLGAARPRLLAEVTDVPALIITVCDRAHEEVGPAPEWLHWSIADPVPTATPDAFDAARDEIASRILELAERAA